MVENWSNKKKIQHIFFFVSIFIVLCLLSIWKLDTVPFHGDESSWISSSESFEAFISFDYKSPVWQESYWTLTQPPIARYFIGIGRNIAGYGTGELNNPYDYFLTEEENIALNTIPNDELLWWSRLPMAILMATSLFLFFLGIYKLYNLPIGLLSIAMFLLNPYPFNVLRLALGESPLLFFSILAIFFGYLFLRTKSDNKVQFWLWLILMCTSCGLAAASKLNGGATVLGALIILFFKIKKEKTFAKTLIGKIIFILGAAIFSFSIFVLVNPFLYNAPLKNSLSMLMFRSYEIGLQVDLYPAYHISGFWQQIQTDVLRIFQQHAILHFHSAWIINLLLFGLGIFLLIKNRTAEQIPLLLSFLCIASALAIPSLFTPLDYPRYFLFPTIFSQLIISFAIASILIITWNTLQKKIRTIGTNLS